MKIVFAGSPQYAVPSLDALIKAGKEVVAVITQPDKPVGRKKQLTPTPVKQFALSQGLPVLDYAKLKEHEGEVEALGADIMITCAYGQILTKPILAAFPKGVWNLHASLLPKFRGASPIQSAILAGECHTGVTVMKTQPELDAGDILMVKRCEIGDLTCGELSDKLSLLSAEAVLEAVELLESGQTQTIIQDESLATYCKKIAKTDAKIDFSKSCEKVVNLINAMSPSPVAFCNFEGGTLNIYKAKPSTISCDQAIIGQVVTANKHDGIVVRCGQGAINILFAQLAGGKVLSATDLINGRKIKEGDRLD